MSPLQSHFWRYKRVCSSQLYNCLMRVRKRMILYAVSVSFSNILSASAWQELLKQTPSPRYKVATLKIAEEFLRQPAAASRVHETTLHHPSGSAISVSAHAFGQLFAIILLPANCFLRWPSVDLSMASRWDHSACVGAFHSSGWSA